ncbi:MAG: hypothetical protein ACP5NI_01655 [Acetobacteraceae bacterium]
MEEPSAPPATPVPPPFANVAEAWFWTMTTLRARRAGAARCLMAEEILRCLDRLYRRRRIELAHARILRIWGERREAPPLARSGPTGDWKLWHEALERLEPPLRAKGIIA